MWFFGNLYEQVVWNPQLLADPRPGSLVGVFAAGSPIYYYLPWGPLAVVLAVVTRAPWPALASLGVSVALKILLITQVNPVFRDPAGTREVVHDHAVLWAFGNGVVVITVAVAILLIQRAARRGATPGGRPSAEPARPS
jgi:F0F1-type ATP synthase membrane subunit c/vacuolar-type H+-ATPase subunit K